MKIPIHCMQCLQEQGYPSLEYQFVEINDDGIQPSTCSRGHVTTTVLQEQKFEILFQFAAIAIIDGYHREAITSMAAALERFYAFYVTVICLKHNVTTEKFNEVWAHASKQSERQFGAYLFSYLIDHKSEATPVIDNSKPTIDGIPKGKIKNWKEFRNSVVHNGYIPSLTETMAYGSIIYNHIHELINDLQKNSASFIGIATSLHMFRGDRPAECQVTTMSIPTIISLARHHAKPPSFESSLAEVPSYRKWLHPG